MQFASHLLRSAQLEIERQKEHGVQMSTVKNMLEAQLASTREQYRAKLLNYLGEEGLAAQLANEEMSALFGDDDKEVLKEGGSDNNLNKDNNGKSKSAATREANHRGALEETIKSFKDREKQLSEQLEKMRNINAENVRKNHFLYNKYNSLKDVLEDVAADKTQIPADLPKEVRREGASEVIFFHFFY
tara:strand:- start:161 stop:724 length:564 start_codon:yes stop_codon:yes gene_type:complete